MRVRFMMISLWYFLCHHHRSSKAHRKCERGGKKRERERIEKKRRRWLMIDVLRTESIDGLFFPFLRSNIVANEKKKRKLTRLFLLLANSQLLYIFFFPLFGLGDQTRASFGQVQKQVSQMVPKQGIKMQRTN